MLQSSVQIVFIMSLKATKRLAVGWVWITIAPVLHSPTGWNYTHVCGRVRGYMLGNNTRGIILERNNTDSHYADGVLITTSEHLWTYAVGMNDTHCPCRFGAIFLSFINCEHHYCEHGRISWENTLWDEANCVTNNPRCKRQGWFHRRVQHFTDNIEVR